MSAGFLFTSFERLSVRGSKCLTVGKPKEGVKMDWSGRGKLVSLALLALVAAIFPATVAMAAPQAPPTYFGTGQLPELPNGLPQKLGPAIIDAVYDPGAAGLADDRLILVMNRSVDPLSVQSTDFEYFGVLRPAVGATYVVSTPGGIADVIITITNFATAFAPGYSLLLYWFVVM
jgi:hypothetical protein